MIENHYDFCTGYTGEGAMEENLKIITMDDMKDFGKIDLVNLERHKGEKLHSIGKLKMFDVILEAKGHRNRAYIIENNVKDVVISDDFIVLRVNNPTASNPYFIVALLNSIECRKYFKENRIGTDYPKITLDIVKLIDIDRVCVEEQHQRGSVYKNMLERQFSLYGLIEDWERGFLKNFDLMVRRA